MKIALGTDHAGYALKEHLKILLQKLGHEVLDFGCFSEESVDYPQYVYPAAKAVADGKCERAIVFGGSGNGEAIVANKVRGIRCTLCWNHESARLAREHNDSNCLALGGRMVTKELASEIMKIWLETEFEGGRHERRLKQILELEKERA